MNRLEMIGGLLNEIGADPVTDRILAQAALIILDRLSYVPPQEPEPEQEPAKKKPKKNTKTPKKEGIA